ncbi:hypothetical protein, partial [Ralstonia sp. GX3-BWBA]|uniref:hypothetical protein n=1 Tax=Ralstonia sp. GX3-BWBA TaxID=2219865 RepID=UPI001EF76C94
GRAGSHASGCGGFALAFFALSYRHYAGGLRLWFWGWFSVGGPSLVSSPAGADSLFFVLPKKSKQKKGAPEMAKDSLNLCRREGGEANSLRSNSLPSFSSLQQKFKAPSRAPTATPSQHKRSSGYAAKRGAKQKATQQHSNKQQATSNKQQATSNKQQATSNKQQARA